MMGTMSASSLPQAVAAQVLTPVWTSLSLEKGQWWVVPVILEPACSWLSLVPGFSPAPVPVEQADSRQLPQPARQP